LGACFRQKFKKKKLPSCVRVEAEMGLFKWCMKVKSNKRMFLAGLLLLKTSFSAFQSEEYLVIKNFSTTSQTSHLQLPIQPFPESVNFQKFISTTTNYKSTSSVVSASLAQPHWDYNFSHDSEPNINFTNLWSDVKYSFYYMKYQSTQVRKFISLTGP
jgi:hypothetical protein